MSPYIFTNKLAALLVYWWAKLNCWAQLLLKNVSYRYLELGRPSHLEFISASSICHLEFSMSFKQHTPTKSLMYFFIFRFSVSGGYHILSHTWVRYPGFWGHGVKCPILTTVVPGFPAIWLAVPFGANGAHLGICTLPEKIFFVCEISCFWVK